MSSRELLHDAVARLQPIIHGVGEHQIAASTPCQDYDVRALVNHLLGTTEAMRRIGAGEPLDPQDPWGMHGDHVGENWRDDLGNRLNALAQAWALPQAWDGAAMDGALPRDVAGEMCFVEVLLHGWDLAQATDREVDYGSEIGARAREVLELIGEQGRGQGAFGAPVEVSEDASDFDHALGLSGRDPHWRGR